MARELPVEKFPTLIPPPFSLLPYYITYSVYNSENDYVYYTNDPLLPRNLKLTDKAKVYFDQIHMLLFHDFQNQFLQQLEPLEEKVLRVILPALL